MPDNVMTGLYEKTPWHKRGTTLNRTFTASEALQLGKLDYDVVIEPTFCKDGTPALSQATRRSDNLWVLGSVGGRYAVLQNRDAFNSLDRIVGAGQAMYNSVFSLGLGEKVCMSLKLPQEYGPDNDKLQTYIVLANSHDGSLSLTYMSTLVSVVCENTLNVALNSKGSTKKKVSIKHTINMNDRMLDAEKMLREMHKEVATTAEILERYQALEFSDADFKKVMMALVPPPKDAKKVSDIPTRTKNIWGELKSHWLHGQGMELKTRKNTAYGAINAIAEYVDYSRTTRETVDPKAFAADPSLVGNKVDSLLFGSGADFKQKGVELIEELLANGGSVELPKIATNGSLVDDILGHSIDSGVL